MKTISETFNGIKGHNNAKGPMQTPGWHIKVTLILYNRKRSFDVYVCGNSQHYTLENLNLSQNHTRH